MLILIDMLCVYVLNVDVVLFGAGSQDVMIKMTINILFLGGRFAEKVHSRRVQ